METTRTVLFNHIPKTGGLTLRIILNRVYGEQNVFFIKSTDIRSSIEHFSKLGEADRDHYAAITGHGAEFLSNLVRNPFRITIVREPVTLFLSQYYFLKFSKSTGFHDEVGELGSPDEYVDYAIARGQDNLLTRYLSNSIRFIIDPGQAVPDLKKEGPKLLSDGMKALEQYDAVIDLDDFDAGVFELAGRLGWKCIPLYRPSNINRLKPATPVIPASLTSRLQEVLQYDIALYEHFKKNNLAAGTGLKRNSTAYRVFRWRQDGIALAAKWLKKY